ncbi:MAG: hypothetical protein HUJ22_02140 [Gracilimonas sp.]|uniref:hypothetical protein n=1 Tax=Gracilimonas sp. TaxID=1974203 RepID=UPI00198E99FB|nr:hypothetical protein [Gracilimonas sp.]MBD3615345.1 hypothetical protein [Gracilimonas sp.]
MSNKLKTLSNSQLETLISKSISEYLNEEVKCNVHHTDIPNIDDEDKIEHSNKRTMTFRADLSYTETDRV